MEPQSETAEALRQLTLQIMLVSAGVFGIVGGFVSSTEKIFALRWVLATALIAFALSTLAGYLLHGVMISLLDASKFDPFDPSLVWLGVVQIGLFVLGGFSFTWFVISNVNR